MCIANYRQEPCPVSHTIQVINYGEEAKNTVTNTYIQVARMPRLIQQDFSVDQQMICTIS